MNNTVIKTIDTIEKFLDDKKQDQSLVSIDNRIALLKKIKEWIITNMSDISNALKKDLNKSEIEALVSEIHIVVKQTNFYIKKIKKFYKHKKVKTNYFIGLGSKSFYSYKPLGTIFCINPYNYPFHLSMMPIVTSIASGNFLIIKNSPKSFNTSRLILKMIQELNLENIISFIDENATKEFIFDIISKKPDMLFFTGSKVFGDELRRQCNMNNVKVVLELGSACPVIVDETADISLTAKRIVWAKLLNMGQTCVGPNSIFCDSKVYERLVDAINSELINQYNPDKFDYVKMTDTNQIDNLINNVKNLTNVELDVDRSNLTIKPTLIKVAIDNPILYEESFGPILFITQFSNLSDFCKSYKNKINNSLALYLFTKNEYNVKNVYDTFQYGSLCVNELLLQVSNANLPFGGVKKSGTGRYHGYFGLQEFSNVVSIVKGSNKNVSYRYLLKANKYKGIIKFLIKK